MSENTRLTRDQIEIREAITADRPEIEAIAARIWEGNDYLPNVLDGWFDEETGTFNVITLQDKIVCLGKLSMFDKGEWWMEGLRVNPDYQGRGLARIMHHYLVAQARQMGSGVVRFSTGSHNEAVRRLASETGFQEVGRYTYYKATPDVTIEKNWWQLTLNDLPQLQTWLDNSPLFQDMQHSFEDSWKWFLATDRHLATRLEAGQVYGWDPAGNQELVGVIVVNKPEKRFKNDDDSRVRMAFIDAREDVRAGVWQAARGLAAELGYEDQHVHLYDSPAYIEAAEAAGWFYGRDNEEFRAVLYSRPISLTDEAEVRFEEIPSIEPET